MLSFEDPRWDELESGYRVLWDPRPYLCQLAGPHRGEALETLWENLFHQGVVGTASYASVPQLLGAGAEFLAASIEVARVRATNPQVPAWLEPSYFDSISSAVKSSAWPTDRNELMGRFALLAAVRGEHVLAEALLLLDEAERLVAEYRGAT